MNRNRRRLMLGTVGMASLFGAGCITRPLRPANADGTYCYRIGKEPRPKLSCTLSPIPGEQVEATAKRFEPTPGRLTVYIVRKRWADALSLVRIDVDAGAAVALVPESFARLRLAPGSHTLIAKWPEGSTSLELAGAAGEVVFVELIGSGWAWGTRFRMERADRTESQERASRLRLVDDLG